MKAVFFATPTDFRNWLKKNHGKELELWVGYYKKDSGIPSITWPESVDQALCFGWIDGLRKSIDEKRYKIRFTPRKANSNWSAVNIKRVAELKKSGLMEEAGNIAFERRKADKTNSYFFEQQSAQLSHEFEQMIKANSQAWDYFSNKLQPAAKKQSIWWVMIAKKEETQLRRMKILIESSAAAKKIPPLIINKKK